jgi:hypothetical protein
MTVSTYLEHAPDNYNRTKTLTQYTQYALDPMVSPLVPPPSKRLKTNISDFTTRRSHT